MPKPRVLIVEDAHDTRVELRELLEDEGYTVATACTGREALTWLRSTTRPDVALIDLRMPIMDGAELASAMRSDVELAKIPIVIMTAAEIDDGVRALADGHIRKPASRDEILHMVELFAGRP